MRILYVAMKHDYGDPARGLSFEHWNFYEALSADGHELIYFDFMSLIDRLGRQRMNRRLLDLARAEEPELMFSVLFKDELDPKVVRRISNDLPTTTLNWFCDDHWRFEAFSASWAPCFNWVVTTAASALPKYAAIGYANAIGSQWGCNRHVYRRLDLPLSYDVSFVGQPYGRRREAVEALREAGISVLTRGHGWEQGRASQEEMVGIFNQSRINLNLPQAAAAIQPPLPSRGPVGRAARRVVRATPGGARAVAGARTLRSSRAGTPEPEALQAEAAIPPEQVKARPFEIAGCGGFVLTGPAEGFDRYYEADREVALFDGVDDLVAKAAYFLEHEDERLRIAEAGYARTLRDHTYTRRFQEIFARIGLSGL